jgi:membrane protein
MHVPNIKHLGKLFVKTAKAWNEKDPFKQSAAVAYYAIFSIPALLTIVIAVAGLIFGREAVTGEISGQISTMMGEDTGKSVEEMVAKASEKKDSIIATIISIVVLIFGATGVFAQFQKVLELIWEVKPAPKKAWLKTIKDRLLSFGLIISIGFLLMISLVVTTALAAVGDKLMANVSEALVFVFRILNFVLSLGVITVLFALMFKFLPDVKVEWRDVWIGSLLTGILFTIGKFALAFYFGKAEPGSAYGAAGTIVLILLWVSYSCMIVFFGAEFTKQYALDNGHDIIPTRDAKKLNETDIALNI